MKEVDEVKLTSKELKVVSEWVEEVWQDCLEKYGDNSQKALGMKLITREIIRRLEEGDFPESVRFVEVGEEKND